MTRRNFLDIIGYAIGSYSIAILPGRLMVGRMTLDHVAEGSNPSPAANQWRYRLGVRTGGSQPSNQGSIPCSATNPTNYPQNI